MAVTGTRPLWSFNRDVPSHLVSCPMSFTWTSSFLESFKSSPSSSVRTPTTTLAKKFPADERRIDNGQDYCPINSLEALLNVLLPSNFSVETTASQAFSVMVSQLWNSLPRDLVWSNLSIPLHKTVRTFLFRKTKFKAISNCSALWALAT